MSYDIGPRIGIEGEKEFRDAIAKINTGLKTLDTEMEKVASRYEKGDKSVEALTSRNVVLNKEIDEQRKKLDTLQKYLGEATKKYGENSQETQRLQQSTNKAEAALNGMERELKENNTAIDAAKKKSGELGNEQDALKGKSVGLGDALNGVASKLGISIPDGAKNSLNSMATLNTGMLASAGIIAGVAVAVYKVIDALGKMAEKQAVAADKVNTMSIVTNVGTDTLQEFQYASEQVDVSVEMFTGSLTKLTNTMDTARKGNKDTADAYNRLGISITDSSGQLRNAEDVFWDVIDALGSVQSASERDALAMDIMGKSAQDLNPLIKIGSDGFNDLAQRAHEMGYVLSAESLSALQALDDQMKDTKNTTEALSKAVSVEAAPAFTDLNAAWQAFNQSLMGASSMGSIFDPLIEAASTLLNLLAMLNSSIGMVFSSPGSAEMLMFTRSYDSAWSNIEEMGERKYGQNATGTDYWAGGWSLVGERGPELINIPPAQIFSAAESEAMTRNAAALQLMGGDSYSYGGSTNITLTMDEYWFGRVSKLINQADSARQQRRAGR